MKRVSREALEAAAWAENRLLEIDRELNIAVLNVKGKTFYADLPPVAEDAS